MQAFARLEDRRRRLRFASEAAADLVQGTTLAGMCAVLEGRAGAQHASAVAALVLRGLGLAPAEADAIARRPLPLLSTAAGRGGGAPQAGVSSPISIAKAGQTR